MRSSFLFGMLCMTLSLSAQYPTIPDSVKERAAREEAVWNKLDEQAWKRAFPVVAEQHRQGRPYCPWASVPEELQQAFIPAFPGAEGGGAYTPGGRGGRVYVVTSLDDDGPGTFREACEAGGARIIVFNVAGVIHLTRPVTIRAPYVTIAGQTAPGDGVCITGASVHIDTHDVIIRYMRFRRGATDVAWRDDALGGNAVGNIIIDHCSCSWGLDENLSLYRHIYDRKPGWGGMKLPSVNVTIQNSISSEALDTYNHAFGSTIGGHNTLFARNLFACNISRNCSVGMDGDFNFVNNVIFNWWNRTIDGGDHRSRYNIIANYYKPGPVTPKDKPIAYRIIKPESGRDEASRHLYGKVYAAGNVTEGYPKVTADNWAGGVQLPSEVDAALVRVDAPMPMPAATLMSALEAYQYVLDHVGATLPKRDAVDARIVKSVRTGEVCWSPDASRYSEKSPYITRRLPADSYKQGIITDPRQVGGLPLYVGTPYQDSDSDGMPDSWETLHGLNPQDASDSASDSDGNGYTAIEEFLNEGCE